MAKKPKKRTKPKPQFDADIEDIFVKDVAALLPESKELAMAVANIGALAQTLRAVVEDAALTPEETLAAVRLAWPDYEIVVKPKT